MKLTPKNILPVSRSIALIFLLAVSTLVFFGRIVYLSGIYTSTTDKMVAHTYRVMDHLAKTKSGIAESQALVSGYLLQPRKGAEEELKKLHTLIKYSISTARQLAIDPTQKQFLSELELLILQKQQQQLALFNQTTEKGKHQSGKNFATTQQEFLFTINAKLARSTDRQNWLLQQRTHASDAAEQRLIRIAYAGAMIIIMFIAVLLWQLNKDILRRKKAEQEIRASEIKYRKLIEGPGTITFTANLKGEFEFVSAKSKVLTGYTSFELQGQSFYKLVPEAWHTQVLENFEQQFHECAPEKIIRFPIVTKNGEEKWVKLTSLIISNDEHIVGFQCTVKDITDKMEAESKLKESEELVQTLLNNTNEGFFMVDRDLTIRVMNKPSREGMELRTGKKVEVGMNLLTVIPHSIIEDAKLNFVKVFNGEYVEYEARYDTAEGVQWLRISHSPVREQNEITGAAVVTSDITSIKRNEEKIREADQKIRAMLSSSNEGFYMIAPDYAVIMINEAGKQIVKRICGNECNEGDSMMDVLQPERKEKFRDYVERALSGNEVEADVYCNDAEGELWIHNTYFPVRNEANEVIAVCIAGKNITEQKLVNRAWEKVREEREENQFRLQSILDHTPLIMFIKDLDGRYLLVNRSFREAFSLTDEVVIGKSDFDFEDDDAAIRYREADEKVIAFMEHVQTDETVQMADGEHNLLIVKFPLFDRDNILYGVGGIATDITERVQSREKLVEAKRKAESAEQLQEQFLANMSHEIRTPLNGIIGMTNVLQHTPLSEEQEEFVQIIRQSSDNLLMLINDILDLSKIKAGKLSVEQVSFDLQKVLEQAVAPFRLKAKEKEIALSIHCDRSVPQQLIGDPLRITQILSNLLGNAMKFTETGSIEIRVCELLAQKENKTSISISVTDTGIGIADEKLEHVFESFEQAASETSRKYGGTGLGLSITRQLCEMMGGTIAVSSEFGKGTTFRVQLPFTISEIVPVVTPVYETVKRNDDISGKKILVAEDNEINQKVIMHVLQRVGISTTIVDNGKEAVELLEAGEEFDLIILDLQMPIMNGFQTATYIRKKLELTVPIIAMTASALRNEKMRCFELGMNEYLTKPFVPADLYTELRRFLLAQPANGKANTTSQTQQLGTELYNLSHLYEMEDQEYFCEVLQLFLTTTPSLLSEIREATLYENWEEVYRKAHKLKSSLGILQMNLMLGLVSTIELQAKEQQNIDRIPDGLKKATDLYELIRPMIEAELEKATQINT
jgi:PAS domain S-box-containing protein